MKIGFKAIKKKAKEGMTVGKLSEMVNQVVKESLKKYKVNEKPKDNYAEELVEELKGGIK